MKDWTADEITADLQRIDAEIKSGKVKLYSLAETKKHMDEVVKKLKKQRAKEQQNETKQIGQRRAATV